MHAKHILVLAACSSAYAYQFRGTKSISTESDSQGLLKPIKKYTQRVGRYVEKKANKLAAKLLNLDQVPEQEQVDEFSSLEERISDSYLQQRNLQDLNDRIHDQYGRKKKTPPLAAYCTRNNLIMSWAGKKMASLSIIPP